jgi:hypothetical protein
VKVSNGVDGPGRTVAVKFHRITDESGGLRAESLHHVQASDRRSPRRILGMGKILAGDPSYLFHFSEM